MEIIKTPISDLIIVKPRVFADARGFFCETYNEKAYHDAGINLKFCQDNQSKSSYGVIRGLHYQLYPQSQSKLVSAAVGSVWDVAVDLRKDSPTFGQSVSVVLSAVNNRQLYIPKGFAHGFYVRSTVAEFLYKCDAYYNPQAERGLLWSDATLGIDWGTNDPVVSPKDTKWPVLADISTEDLF